MKKLFKMICLVLIATSLQSNITFAHNDNYGVLCYEYKNCFRGKKDIYNPNTVNLGDYVQSLAAMQYLPKNTNDGYTLIDRDSLCEYNGPKVKMIMNGWYFINEKNHVASDKINPLYVAFHINNGEDLGPKMIDYLKKHEPIGCRDYQTKRFLDKNGVKTYFSGCLTTTLDIDYKVPESERTNEIIFCDYKMGTYPQADNYLKSLKNYDFSKAEFVTHNFTKNSTHEERFKESDRLLKKYARAKLVVTSRIHCALPCLALGTPVILIKRNYDVKRFDGLYSLLNTIGKDKNKNFKINVKKDDAGNVINSDDYLKYRSELIKKCSNFTKLCGAGENK